MIQYKISLLQYGNFLIFSDISVGYEIRKVLEFSYEVLETSNVKVLDMKRISAAYFFNIVSNRKHEKSGNALCFQSENFKRLNRVSNRW
jgi:hypothetical protein